jgi:hypothetical protein
VTTIQEPNRETRNSGPVQPEELEKSGEPT